MAKRPTIEEQLARLHALRDDPDSEAARLEITSALASARGTLAAAAAELINRAELGGFEAALRAAFERFMPQPVKSDPGCRAKIAVARALYGLGARTHDVFLRGIAHVQPEPIWGGTQDTAVELRGVCALGLVRGGYPDALIELADLLADAEPMARVAAAQAISYSERADIGVPLLRLKVLSGDADPRVTSACFAGLLSLAPDSSLAFVAHFADAGDEALREAALLALGESRLPGALPLLCSAAERALSGSSRRIALLAIALMRSDPGWEHLLTLVRDGDDGPARDAIDALATYRDDRNLCDRVLDAATARGDAALLAHARKALAAGKST